MNKLKLFTLCLALFGFSSFSESPGLNINGILTNANNLDKFLHDLHVKHEINGEPFLTEDGEIDPIGVVDILSEASPQELEYIEQDVICNHQKSLLARFNYECKKPRGDLLYCSGPGGLVEKMKQSGIKFGFWYWIGVPPSAPACKFSPKHHLKAQEINLIKDALVLLYE